MRYTYRRGLFWVGLYVLLSAVPLGIALAGNVPEARDFWIEFGVALGFIAYTYFTCGPEPMMDVVEIGLRNLGIDWRRIYTERFEIV